jgi:hypothetical protein
VGSSFIKRLIFHVGWPETGMTSIQSTLFWSPPKKSFWLVTLDINCGNQLTLAAFVDRLGSTDSYFEWIMFKSQMRKLIAQWWRASPMPSSTNWTPRMMSFLNL